MISYDQALQLIAKCNLSLDVDEISLAHSLGRVLAEDIMAPIDLPPFDNSAVDGFALATKDIVSSSIVPVMGEIRAVASRKCALADRASMRIMTGAPLPVGADAVIMKEDVVDTIDVIELKKAPIVHENIRRRGEDIEQGKLAARRGTKVSPRHIGFFAALGLSRLKVWRPPRIMIISTGDELVSPGEPLRHGQVYSLMGPMLRAQCAALGIHDVVSTSVSDDISSIVAAINAHPWDILLVTGGMSKGDYDFVRRAFSESSIEEIFYRISVRPGKPIFFGHRKQGLVFGLPGNPVAAFVGFHVFVRSLIERIFTGENYSLPIATVTKNIEKPQGLTCFMRADVNERHELSLMPGQGSHQLYSLCSGNALAIVPGEKAVITAGETLRYYALN